MAPNSHELIFSENIDLVSAQFSVLDDVNEFKYFARSFRDELASLAILRDREELGVPDLVVACPPFNPTLARSQGILQAVVREIVSVRGSGRRFGEVVAEFEAFLCELGHGRGRGQRQ
ncbi:unnamed protein product [Lasius platythorax]|uniref:Uncharacterized protein n=1 Tax=Lasius platythorax TaxID=488582 RepID=A0AAV2MZG3_9HYME